MPEGHTVARLARDHAALLVGRPVRVSSPQGRFADGAALLDGRVVLATLPRGKHLWYAVEGDLLLHVHLGLYGAWRSGPRPEPAVRGALRLRLLTEEHWLDLRGPTACEVHAPHERQAVLDRLGPDPLDPAADPALALARVQRSRRSVAELLMDQSVLAGVGNVYRAEVLYRAGVAPMLPGTQVTPELWADLWSDLVRLMRAGVRANRIVTTDPADRERPSGAARRVDAHYVYRRAGLPCRRCGTAVATSVVAGRNLFWCPRCQSGVPGQASRATGSRSASSTTGRSRTAASAAR